MSSHSGSRSLIAPVTRKRKLQMSVHVASCRGCINNVKCQVSEQHGKTLVDEKVCTFTTNALLEDITHSIDILESAAMQPTGGSRIHPFMAIGSSSPAVLASAMEMLASQISSESETLVQNPTLHLLRCWRIVASFADALSSGTLAVFSAPLAFCLRRFSPLSPKSSIAGTFCSRKLWQTGERQFSNGQRNELLCFIIASILAAMRITCLESIISSFATIANGTSPEVVVDSWRAELSGLRTLLLEAFGFRGPTSVAEDFGRFVFVRNTLIEVFLAFERSEQCLILDATQRFPLAAGITQLWICGQGQVALGGNVLEGLAFEAVSFSLLFVNDGVVWSRDVCAEIIARLERDHSVIAGASCSDSAYVPHCLAEASLLHRLTLVIGLVDYRSRFWRLVGGSQETSSVKNDFLQWRVEDHDVPYSAQLVPKGVRLTDFQHRCLVIARGTLCSLFLPDRNRNCGGTNHVDHSCSLDLFAPAVFSAVAMVPLICELLSATQLSAAEWRSIVRAKLESGRRSHSPDSSARATRLLTRKIAASLGRDSPCRPQRHAANSTQESGLSDGGVGIDTFSYDLSSFFFGQKDSEDNPNVACHTGKLFGVCAGEDAEGDGHCESAMNQGFPVFSQAFFVFLACAPQAIAKSVYKSVDVEKDIAPVHYSAQGVRGANVTPFKSPNGGTSGWLLSSPFSSPSTLVPPYFLGWAISASIPSLLAAEEIEETGVLSKSKHMTFGSQCVVESLISLQRSIATLNKDLLARGKRSLSLLESDLDALISVKDAEVEFTQISEEHLMAPISFLIGEPFVSPSRKLLTHCCAVQSPFWMVGSPAVTLEASAQRNYLRAPNPSFADRIQKRGGHLYNLPLASLTKGSCEFFADYLKNASSVLHTLRGKAFALRHLHSQGQAGSGTLTPPVALVVTDVCLAQLSIFNPIELTRFASACTVSLGPSQSNDQKEADRVFGGHLLTLQKYLPMARTPEVARTIAAIFLREKSYLLPDTGLLTRVRTELILPWQPDLAHMFRPSFHKAMLLAACALVLKRGLPADVVVWGIIRAYIPSELKEETIYEKGAALVNKCSVA